MTFNGVTAVILHHFAQSALANAAVKQKAPFFNA